MKWFTLFIYLLGFSLNLAAIHSTPISMGKSAAMANTSVTLSDTWSVYYNQAGLGFLEKISVGAYHQSGFINEQNLQGITAAIPTKTGTIAGSYSYYGYSNYNEMQAGLAFGRAFTKYISVGIQLNYLRTQIAGNYENSNCVNFEIGILSQPIENLLIGAHVYNPSRSKVNNEVTPTVFKIGAGYLFSDKVLLGIESEMNTNHNPIFKAGIDYKLINFVSLQTGISTNPSLYSFGIGFHFKSFDAHVAFIKHQTLGFTPSFSLSYGF